MKSKLIYLDVCVLSRPFDDQHLLRNRLETEATNLILSQVKQGRVGLVVSPVHRREIEAIPDVYERTALQTICEQYGFTIAFDVQATRQRAEALVALGFGVADAAHAAFAERSSAALVSCDDRFLKKCLVHVRGIWCGNPVAYCEKERLR